MMQRALALFLLLAASVVEAHRPSDAFLDLRVDGSTVDGNWQIALRDIVTLVDLDANRDGQLTWGELRSAGSLLTGVLGSQFELWADEQRCDAWRFGTPKLNERNDGTYLWLSIAADCPEVPETLGLSYRLFQKLDPTHRGIVVLHAGEMARTAVLDPGAGIRSFALDQGTGWSGLLDYVQSGIWHIWIGLDHILFLLALLLPSVLRYQDGRWVSVPRLRDGIVDVVGVVTAFTLAHSVTLTAAALGWIQLPSALVESLIAASVILAALNNVFPVIRRARWILAFGFGLIHGFGFASVVSEFDLPEGLRLAALIAFNLGVELGQVVIVLAVMPLAFALRSRPVYIQGLRVYGSLAVAVLAAVWLLQRSGVLDGL